MVLFNVLCIILAASFSVEVEGHGFMISPPNRASLWRIDLTQPINYNDNEYFCGGTHVQYYVNQGRCGPCGDDWRDPVPRSNENGGKFGNGIIVANYTAGSKITVTTIITANHLGSLYFHICQLQNASEPESEECFQTLQLADGSNNYPVDPLDHKVEVKVKLPKDLVCERCVLRWHYRTGNSWGMCKDGTQSLGCGNQEIFRSCADIRIVPGDSSPEVPPEDPEEDSNSEPDDDDNLPDSHESNEPCIINPYYKPHGIKNRKK